MSAYLQPFESCSKHDVDTVGGKNASLGEMISHLTQLGVRVPTGFATTALAYRDFLNQSGLKAKIDDALNRLDVDDLKALAQTGLEIRQWILNTPLPPALESELLAAYQKMGGSSIAVAVRSSATAEDLPDASFAGQQETLLNVVGETALLQAVHEVFASLYNDRAIAYRVHQGFAHAQVALSVGIQHMVRSDRGAAGVMFTLDTESGFKDVVFITASYGLGETVVQGAVNPDEFYVYKPNIRAKRPAIVRKNLGGKALKMVYSNEPGERVKTVAVTEAEQLTFSIDDAVIEELARQALIIEDHYGCPMDIEWGLDGDTRQVYILQARPETVQSRQGGSIERFKLHGQSKVLAQGRAIGSRIGSGVARLIKDVSELVRVQPGDVLVTDMTDPDWEPVMKKAAAIVTNRGGRTCHAAIIARELGIPAVVGCNDATQHIAEGTKVTVSCAEGDIGHVYEGLLEFERTDVATQALPSPPVGMTMNVGNPDRAFDFAAIPNQGVGLARLEFIINRMIGVHPKALLEFDEQVPAVKAQIKRHMAGYPDPVTFYVHKMAEGIAQIGAAFAPHTVIVRLSDFKSNEYANLIGGNRYEAHEENPMLGFRGAARYLNPQFQPCFELECRALKYVRETMGLKNVQVMVPFVRSLTEAKAVIDLMEQNGLKRGEHDLKIMMMCELPTNALLADQFLEYFDGFSIGSNDMTQLVLGVDRDSGSMASHFDERDPAVKAALSLAIRACRKANKYVGICGQGPSDHPDLADWLVQEGISSLSLNPDTVLETWLRLTQSSRTPA